MSFLTRFRKPSLFTAEAFAQHTLLCWGDGRVQAGVVRLNNGSAELLGVATGLVNGLKRSGNPDMDRLLAGSDQAISQAEEMTHLAGNRKVVPDYLAICVPADLVESLPLTVLRDRQGQSEPIGQTEVQALLERGFRQAQDTLDLQDTHGEIIYGSIGQFALDGQYIPDPIGLHGGQLEASLCFNTVPLEWLRAMEKLAQRLELSLTLMIPEQAAFAAMVADDRAWLVIMDNHHTLIGLLNHDYLMWSVKIPVGEREIVGEIGKAMGLHGREADVLMRTYREGQIPQEVENNLVRVFWHNLRHWMDVLAIEAGKALSDYRIPPSVFYFIDQSGSMSEAKESLETTYWEHRLPFERSPQVLSLDSLNVRDVLDYTAQAGSPAFLLMRSLANAVAKASAGGNNWGRSLLQIVRGRRFERR
ncbi:MAG: hypothetical protein ACYCZF_11445 [Anaerolineae bacterium]